MVKKFALLTTLLTGAPAMAHKGHHEKNPNPTVLADAAESENAILQKISVDYQREVEKIFSAKCADCHSSAVNAPWYAKVPLVGWLIESDRSEAKEHLEISQGFPFRGHGSPIEDLEEISEVVSENSMPPKIYRWMHPSSRLNESEKSQILKWVSDSQFLLKK